MVANVTATSLANLFWDVNTAGESIVIETGTSVLIVYPVELSVDISYIPYSVIPPIALAP